MQNKPPLTLDLCVAAVVNATDYPKHYKAGTSDTTTLWDLGVVTAIDQAHFLSRVKSNINPWAIDSSLVKSSTDTTVQACAVSVKNNAH